MILTMMESSSSSNGDLTLFCDEKMTPPATIIRSSRRFSGDRLNCFYADDNGDGNVDCYEAFQNYLQREHVYQLQREYAEFLSASEDLSQARFHAIRWIFMECKRLDLRLTTAFNAVNYVDRFVYMNSNMKWESWMMELLCISCLSIASKYDEVRYPCLQDFQMEEMEHSFESCTIQAMEVTVLKALDWRLSCVTTYSYIDLLARKLHPVHPGLTARTTELLLQALLDNRLISFSQCVVAIAAIRCAVMDLRIIEVEEFIPTISKLVPQRDLEIIDECSRRMKESIEDQSLSCSMGCVLPTSPVTVLQGSPEKKQLSDFKVDIHSCFCDHHHKRKLDRIL